MPDLTFSEMTFLNTRRNKPEDVSEPAGKKRGGKRDKAADNEAELSRYFASTKSRDVGIAVVQDEVHGITIAGPPKRYHNRDGTGISTYQGRSAPPPVELPETPFLGFGSVGGSLVSPVRRVESPASPPYQSRAKQGELSPARSASYFTWSRTRSPSQRSSHHRDTESMSRLQASKHPNLKDLIRNRDDGKRTTSGATVPHQDGISDDRPGMGFDEVDEHMEDMVKMPIGRDSRDAHEQAPHPPSVDKCRGQNLRPKSTTNGGIEQPSHVDSVDKTYSQVNDADQVLTRSIESHSRMPEDLVNATLKLLLEKYGASITSTLVEVATATDKKPNLSNAAINQENQQVSEPLVPADPRSSEAIEERSGQSQPQEQFKNPRPLSRRTLCSEPPTIDKPSPVECPSSDETRRPLGAQRNLGDLHIRQSSTSNPPPSSLHATDARSAWTGYDAIYEQQHLISEDLPLDVQGDQIQHGAIVNTNMTDDTVTVLGYDTKHMYESGLDAVYDDYGIGNIHSRNVYAIRHATQNHHNQAFGNETQNPQRGEWLNYQQSIGPPSERYLDYEDEHLPKMDPTFTDYDPRHAGSAPTTRIPDKSEHGAQTALTDQGGGEYLLSQRETRRREVGRELHSRPLSQGIDNNFSQQSLVILPDPKEDASPSDFWKPHMLY